MKGKMELTNDKFEKEYKQLMMEYDHNPNPEILERIYKMADKLVLDEKTVYHLKHLALERLEELEKTVELNPLLQYRKAVTLFLMKKKEQAFQLFRDLIQTESVEIYIKDRCVGYVLRYYDSVIRPNEAEKYLKELRKSSDSTALQMLEDIELSGVYDLDQEYEDEESLEEPIMIFTSFDRMERTFSRKVTEANFRIGNGPNDYDLYLDMVQQRYFIFGTEVEFSKREVDALFTMAKMGLQCSMADLYFSVYREIYDNQKKQKDKLQQFTSRFRRDKLGPIGFGFQGTSLPNQYSICLIYNQQYVDYLFG